MPEGCHECKRCGTPSYGGDKCECHAVEIEKSSTIDWYSCDSVFKHRIVERKKKDGSVYFDQAPLKFLVVGGDNIVRVSEWCVKRQAWVGYTQDNPPTLAAYWPDTPLRKEHK